MSRLKLSDIAIGVMCGPILCCWIAIANCCCPSRLRRRHHPSEDRRRFERRQRMAPRPLPVRPLERSLTIPPSSSYIPSSSVDAAIDINIEKPDDEYPPTATTCGNTLDQTQSRLMRLPLELRRMIYRAVVGDSTMHMVLKERKLGHLRCKHPSALECPLGFNGRTLSRECCWGTMDSANIWVPMDGAGAGEPTHGGIVPFLMSCRQVYSEAIDYLYTTNCFSFSDLDCLRYMSSTTLPHRFSLIRTLDIEWFMTWPIYDPIAQSLLLASPALYPPHDEATWEETWRIIAAMPNLKFIRVSLLYFDGFRNMSYEGRMLEPLRKVTRPERFEVHVSWQGEERGEGAPFMLIRPAAGEGESEDE